MRIKTFVLKNLSDFSLAVQARLNKATRIHRRRRRFNRKWVL